MLQGATVDTGKATVYYEEAPESLCGAADRSPASMWSLRGDLAVFFREIRRRR